MIDKFIFDIVAFHGNRRNVEMHNQEVINFTELNPSILRVIVCKSNYHTLRVWEISYPFLKSNDVVAWEWVISNNFMAHFTEFVITHPSWG